MRTKKSCPCYLAVELWLTASFSLADGFNFAENMRTRAERSSISAASPGRISPPMHHRAKSIATAEPIREVPKVAKAPDAFQERILKGDFYMD